jgi:hypothetical protein
VGEVGEAEDAYAPDPRGLDQHALGIAQVLQGVELQHHVEAGVVEQRQAVFQVELDHVDAALRGRQHIGVGDLDAVAAAAAVLHQVRQELAGAAAEVEHAATLGHHFGDQFQVFPLAHAHTPASCPMRSKRAFSSAW